MSKMLLPVITVFVIAYLFVRKKISLKIFAFCLAGVVIAGGLIYTESLHDGRQKVTELDKTAEENADEVIPLQVETADGTDHDVEITIPEKTYSAEEKKALLQKQCKELDKEILGKNKSFDRIEWNLQLPVSFPDSKITCEWDSDHPELVDWDGTLLGDIPAGGTVVTLTGLLRLDEESLLYEKKLHVYPSKEDQVLEEKLQEASEQLNATSKATDGEHSTLSVAGTSGSRNSKSVKEKDVSTNETQAEKAAAGYKLPTEVDGQKVTWYQKTEQRGSLLCGMVLFGAVFSVVGEKKKEQKKVDKRKEQLQREYPDLVSRIQLLTAAGLSLRQCMKRLAGEYTEIQRCWYEMESGVTEQDAYAHLGERCNTGEYRKLALLLAQSQKKGGRQLSMLLEQEVQEAFESRKRRARAEGEKASIRMIFPMGMMLVVVLVIIMVPAMLSF